MNLNRDNSKFDKGSGQAQRSAQEQIKFIVANIQYLKKSKEISAVRNFENMLKYDEIFTPNQLSFIDSLYEKVMKGAGYGSCSLKHDIKKTLRF